MHPDNLKPNDETAMGVAQHENQEPVDHSPEYLALGLAWADLCESVWGGS